eukprot:353037-Chlamydomonas_euryale.AAC.7
MAKAVAGGGAACTEGRRQREAGAGVATRHARRRLAQQVQSTACGRGRGLAEHADAARAVRRLMADAAAASGGGGIGAAARSVRDGMSEAAGSTSAVRLPVRSTRARLRRC